MTQTKQSAFVLQWSDLLRWDLKSARAAGFRAAHPNFRPLGDFIEESTETVHPYRLPGHEWPVYGVNNKEGVVFSHLQRGDAFKSSYKRIRKDWFFHNPTRANVGSLGRVPDVPDDALTSPEYQVWRIKKHLLPDFVEILIRLPFFLELIAYHRVGAVKERLFVENLCEIPIPHLTVQAQRRVIEQWNGSEHEALAVEAEARQTALLLESSALETLGLQSPEAVPLRKAMAMNWSDLYRWGVRFNQLHLAGADITLGRYPLESLGALLTMVQYGTSEKANERGDGIPVLRISNIKEGSLDLREMKHVSLKLSVYEGLRLHVGDVLIIRTSGSRDLVGTSAVFQAEGDYVFASYLIRLRFDLSRVSPDYVSWFLNCSLGRQQIDAVSRQIMMNNINSEEIRSLLLPLPPLPLQNEIMAHMERGRNSISRSHARAAEVRMMAVESIESQILSNRTVNGA